MCLDVEFATWQQGDSCLKPPVFVEFSASKPSKTTRSPCCHLDSSSHSKLDGENEMSTEGRNPMGLEQENYPLKAKHKTGGCNCSKPETLILSTRHHLPKNFFHFLDAVTCKLKITATETRFNPEAVPAKRAKTEPSQIEPLKLIKDLRWRYGVDDMVIEGIWSITQYIPYIDVDIDSVGCFCFVNPIQLKISLRWSSRCEPTCCIGCYQFHAMLLEGKELFGLLDCPIQFHMECGLGKRSFSNLCVSGEIRHKVLR